MSAALPPGFTLDQPAQGGGPTLPAGFRLDPPPAPKEKPVTDTSGVLGYMDPRGPFEAATSMATGMLGSVAGGYAGLAGSVLPGETGQGADWSKRVSEALTYEPRSKSGQALMKVPEVAAMPIHWAAEKVGAQGEKHSPELATIGKTSVEALPLLLGGRAALKGREPLTAEQQKVAKARDAGFKMTPEEMDAGFVPRTAAGLAGEPRLARSLSNKNAEQVLLKSKEELGLKPEVTLDLDALKEIRRQEGAGYDAARGAGEIPMDAKYRADIDSVTAKYRSVVKDFPELANPEIEKYIRALKKEDSAFAEAQAQGIKLPDSARRQPSFDANSGIDLIGTLRDSAADAYRSGQTGLGKIMRGAAEALEGQIERHLAATGRSDILPGFRAARERIAKTHAVEDALLGDDIVNMRKYGEQIADNAPLTGGLKESGKFARNFDRSSQKPTHMPAGATIHDIAMSALNSIRTGGGSMLLDVATVGARPAVRYLLGSRLGQAAMDPRTNLSAPALEAAAVSETVAPPQKKKR